MTTVVLALLGLVTGFGLSHWVERMARTERLALNWPPTTPSTRWKRCALLVLTTAALYAGFYFSVTHLGILETPEVQPSANGRALRMAYHLILISLLIVAVGVTGAVRQASRRAPRHATA